MTEAYCNYIVFKYLVQNGHGDVAKAMVSVMFNPTNAILWSKYIESI